MGRRRCFAPPYFCALALALSVVLPGRARGGETWGLPNDSPASVVSARSGNRLTHLQEHNPYWPTRHHAGLTTPQWIGEPDVEAVVVLAIDDLRDWRKYEAYLRPILERLKQIDGRAPVSIMTNQVDPAEPHLQSWLREGLNLDVHTIDHPCPLLKDGDLARARQTCFNCIDLLAGVPNNRPVAFRMPCCDSQNTVSPRFYAEIFDRVTAAGRFLSIDSSVFNLLTSNDPALPRALVVADDGTERFRRYLPFPSFANTIDDYPYPYLIGSCCWEFPCVVPSDWSAQHVQQPNNPRTIDDWQAALDAVVVKQGVFNLVFHPHNWIRPEQVVEFIDGAIARHGRRVKFLNFREAAERLEWNLTGGVPLRAANGADHGIRLIDVNADGYQDVVIANDRVQQTRVWQPQQRRWIDSPFPMALVDDRGAPACEARFGIAGPQGEMILLAAAGTGAMRGFRYVGEQWREVPSIAAGMEVSGGSTPAAHLDRGWRLYDVDGDGQTELLVANAERQAAYAWDPQRDAWQARPWKWPAGARFVDDAQRDAGLRLVDLNDDLTLDLVYANESGSGVALYIPGEGWTEQALAAQPGESGALPLISRRGTNNGAWFHSAHLWVQNEDTARLKDLVDRRSFRQLLGSTAPRAKSPAESLAALRPRDGLTVELVAAEPLVVDPVAFDWGPDGRFWVAEMRDYPNGIDGDGRPGGRIRCLRDDDGDGRYDRSSVF
ncbi:MAG: hypothetical protein K1X74_14960, partial [Pirellulales bacterium]|nr:hypothetical protein [Pirellulales bacterium]